MKKTTTLISFCGTILVSAAVVWGCGDDDDTVAPKADSGTTDTGASSSGDTGASSSGDTGTKNPPPPVLGAQLDRFGRPAVNTAANNTFNPDAGTAGAAKDGYNADKDVAGWTTKYGGEASKNLAIYDGLDTQCGNQQFADPDASAPDQKLRYARLAGVLTDDRQWLNTAGTCGTFTATGGYLAVELNATGTANTDCGGRRLPVDVIDVTYAIVATAGVTDGIGAVADKTNGTTFPYLAAPK